MLGTNPFPLPRFSTALQLFLKSKMTIKGERKQHVFSCYQRFLNNQVLLGSACLFSPRRRPGRQAARDSGRRGCKFGQVLKAALAGLPSANSAAASPRSLLFGAFRGFPALPGKQQQPSCGQGPGPGGELGCGGRRRRRRKAGGGGVEEPGPGSLPAYRTRK